VVSGSNAGARGRPIFEYVQEHPLRSTVSSAELKGVISGGNEALVSAIKGLKQ
jgi:hypothetical protein